MLTSFSLQTHGGRLILPVMGWTSKGLLLEEESVVLWDSTYHVIGQQKLLHTERKRHLGAIRLLHGHWVMHLLPSVSQEEESKRKSPAVASLQDEQ